MDAPHADDLAVPSCRLAWSRLGAAVHLDHLAVDEGALVGCQQADGGGDLVGRSQAPHGNAADNVGDVACRCLIIALAGFVAYRLIFVGPA